MMHSKTRNLRTSACTLALLGSFSFAFGETTSDAERLLNWAELTYPQIFKSYKTTIAQGPWLYRNYAEAGILAGVNKNDNNVYVMGGPWGNTPTVIGPLSALIARVDGTGDASEICDATVLPEGVTLTRNGNVITATTNGCVVPPENQNFCEFLLPDPPVATGISVLATGALNKFETKGILSTAPGILDEFLQQPGLDFKTCFVNAPSEKLANITFQTNVCYDLTASLGALSGVPGITITPPIQQTLEASATMTRVDDCFATTADSVADLVTNEVWIRESDGSWTNISAP
jgi:hypothetical protein